MSVNTVVKDDRAKGSKFGALLVGEAFVIADSPYMKISADKIRNTIAFSDAASMSPYVTTVDDITEVDEIIDLEVFVTISRRVSK